MIFGDLPTARFQEGYSECVRGFPPFPLSSSDLGSFVEPEERPLRRNMPDLQVATEGDHCIVISQAENDQRDTRVTIDIEQVDTLIAWLKEAKEAMGSSSKGAKPR